MCSEEGFKTLIGCDIKNIIDEFDDDDEEADSVTKFPSNKCVEKFDNIDKLNIHFKKNNTSDKTVICCFNECENRCAYDAYWSRTLGLCEKK